MKDKVFSFLLLASLLGGLLALSGCGSSGAVDAPGMLYFHATW